MKQNDIIRKLNLVFQSCRSSLAVLLIGSFGRNTPKANSDIDYQLLVDHTFDNNTLLELVLIEFGVALKYHIYLQEKRKWCFYFDDDFTLAEVFVCVNLNELDKYYLGSEIADPKTALVFDRTNTVLPYLEKITLEKKNNAILILKSKAEYLVTEFLNRFESLSSAHAKSDGYKFGVLFSHALNAVVRLIYICESDGQYEFMPPNFLTDYSYKLKLGIENLGTYNLREANKHKNELLILFKKYIEQAKIKFQLSIDTKRIIIFLDNIFIRDYFWNFRDFAKFHSTAVKGKIFRTSSLSFYDRDKLFLVLLDNKNIKTIIDLRADREIGESFYSQDTIQKIQYVRSPFDPWNQSIEFKNTYNNGSNAEIAYHFFMLECKDSIKLVMKTIINSSGAIVIHCHAGKDRTGIIIAILGILIGTDKQDILLDYLASEMDSNPSYLEIVFRIIEKEGGIISYLNNCGLSLDEIQFLKTLLCKS